MGAARAAELRPDDLHGRQPALDLPAPRPARRHLEAGVAPLQHRDEARRRRLDRLQARARDQLDGRTIGQRQPRPRRRRVHGDDRAAVGHAQRARIVAQERHHRDARRGGHQRRDDDRQRSAAAALREARVDRLPHSRHRGLVGRIAQPVLQGELELAHDRTSCGPPMCARTASSAAAILRLTVASEQPHADATSASSRPSTRRSIQAMRTFALTFESARSISASSARWSALVPGAASARQRRVVGAAIEAEHAHQPPAPHPPAHQADRDLRQPPAQRRRLAQRGQLLERRHERVLHDLFTFAAVAEQARRDREQVGGVTPVQHLASPAIASRARHQLGVAGGVRILRKDGAHQNAHSSRNDSRSGVKRLT